jgi:hypothetical protein
MNRAKDSLTICRGRPKTHLLSANLSKGKEGSVRKLIRYEDRTCSHGRHLRGCGFAVGPERRIDAGSITISPHRPFQG